MSKLITLTVMFTLISFYVNAQTGWQIQNSGTNNPLYDVCFIDQNTGWVSGHSGTIFFTSDGGNNWNDLNPPPSNYYSDIDFVNQNEGWVAGFAGIIRHSTDGGVSWTEQNSPTGRNIAGLFFTDGNTGWAIGGKPRTFTDPIRDILHTTDGGTNWTIQYTGSNEDPLASIYFIDENIGWAVGSASTIMMTTNGGNNWITQMSGSGYQFSDVYFINPDTGWVVGEDLSLQHYAVIFKTVDGGATWDIQNFGSGDSFSAVQFVNENTGWVVGGNNDAAIIMYTSDGGDNWTPQTPNTTNLLSDVCFVNENKGWAVGFNGTIINYNNVVPVELTSFTANVIDEKVELNWKTSTETNNSGFEIQRKSNLRGQQSVSGNSDLEGYSRIGFVEGNGTTTQPQTYSFVDKNLSNGKYQYRLKQIDYDGSFEYSNEIEVDFGIPEKFSLEQNYPNPFNPTTTIKYTIPEIGLRSPLERGGRGVSIKLTIYNILGNEVATLVNEEKEPGNYTVEFNGTGLASGTYFYSMQAGDFVSVKKMILQK